MIRITAGRKKCHRHTSGQHNDRYTDPHISTHIFASQLRVMMTRLLSETINHVVFTRMSKTEVTYLTLNSRSKKVY